MTLIATINPEGVGEDEAVTYNLRQAARAAVFDNAGKIALLHVTKDNYHKLPGGGIEAGEDITGALVRECREELGCEILVGESLGEVHEYRKQFLQHQISYCFTATVLGQKGTPTFTPEELAAGFTLEWFLPEDALLVLQSETSLAYMGTYVLLRDLAIIQTALKYYKLFFVSFE